MRFLMNLSVRGKFETITHFFPVRGHSFLPCDRDFGSIKILLRKTDRINTPQQYAQLIIETSRCGLFSLHKVQTDEILNFNKLIAIFVQKNSKFRRNFKKSNS